jgi:hypothetical protein
MGLVDNNSMRQTSAASESRRALENTSNIVQLFMVRRMGEVNHQTGVSMAERPQQITRPWQWVCSSINHHSGERLERGVVPLGIEYEKGISVKNHLLAQEPCDP